MDVSNYEFDVIHQLLRGVMKNLIVNDEYALIEDKVTNVTRTRIAAELCSSLVKLHKQQNYENIIEKLTKWLITNQNPSGSWNEKHVNYDKPSAVFTSICALSLLDVAENFPQITIQKTVFENAARFLIDQEISFGYFRKSEYVHADILNVDAMVAAFLIRLGTKYHNDEYIKTGKRALSNICAQQFIDGAYPYGGPNRAYPYKYHFHTPCIHYQTVTLYYMLKSLPYVKSDWLEYSINTATKWLLGNQNHDGYFNWSKSGLNFALYLTATYAFVIPIYLRYSNIDKRTEKMIHKSLEILKIQTIDDILLRWERGSTKSIISGILEAPAGGFIGDYPISHKVLRTLHRVHREISRSKVSESMIASKLATRSSGYSAFLGTVESSTNYPDLYMTAEALDAMTYSLQMSELN